MNIKTILNPLFGKVMKDGKRIPDTRIMVFGTRIFFEDYLLPDDTIVCTDWADFISMRMRGKYNHVEFLSESEIKKMVSEEKLYNYMERKYDMKKFDLVVSNPPYDGDLHLQILNEFMKIGKKCVFIHPARWMEDVLAQYKAKSATGKKFEHLKTALEKVFLIQAKHADEIFHISNNQDMLIGIYSDSDLNPNLPIYDDSKRFFDVLKRVLDYAHGVKSLGDKTDRNMMDGFRVEVKSIAVLKNNTTTKWTRNVCVEITSKYTFTDGFICIPDKNGALKKCHWAGAGKLHQGTYKKATDAPIPLSIKFDSINDGDTFIKLYKSNVVKNIIYMLKYDQNAGHTHIPYFDPKVIKTEDDVLDALGITNEEHRNWLKRDVYDYREKDFIKYREWIDC